MIFSIIAIALFVFGLYVSPRSSVEAARLIMGGPFTLLFWGLAVGLGILFPLALELYELVPHFIKHLQLLMGGFVLRYVVVYAGQMSQILPS